jgi:type II secretory pathway component PulC
MQNKKVIILIALAIFAVISLIHGIMAKPKAKTAIPGIITAGELQAPQGGLFVERRAKRSKFTSWKRSPFVASGTSTSSNLVLSGVIWNKDKPKAMIGDIIVTKGSKIEGNTVVDIKPDRVILNDGTKDFELKIAK